MHLLFIHAIVNFIRLLLEIFHHKTKFLLSFCSLHVKYERAVFSHNRFFFAAINLFCKLNLQKLVVKKKPNTNKMECQNVARQSKIQFVFRHIARMPHR